MFLTDDEVIELTRRRQPAAQARVLDEARIYYTMVDGRPVVPRDQFRAQQPAEFKLRLA